MRRVAHLLGTSSGGIRRHVHYLAAHPPAGYETAGIVGPEILSEYFRDFPFVPNNGPRPWGGLRPEVLHAHGLTAALAALRGTVRWRSLRPRPAVVVTVHTSMRQTLRSSLPGAQLRPVQKALWLLGRLIVHRADAVIAVSAEVAAQVRADDIIPPAIDLPRPASDARTTVRRQLGTPEDRVVVLAVARLHPDKALGVFIHALQGTGAEGWIAGEGPERENLEKLAVDSGVRLLGHRRDVASLLGAADIFALPALAESYGFAVLEAVAAGVPVVATATGSIPELVGDAGILVEPNDTEAFVMGVRRLIQSEELRSQLVIKARTRALPAPLESVVRLGEVYDRVCGHLARQLPPV
jgi:glycosyltransferase involved in cell wall biosynthesis